MTATLRWCLTGVVMVIASLPVLSASAAQIYLETFSSAANNTPVNTVGWFSYKGATAVDSSAVASSSTGIVLSSGAGVGGSQGLAFGAAAAGASIFLFGTEEPGAIAQSNLESTTFYLRQFTAGGGRVALRIDANDATLGDTSDDAWFATDAVFAEAGTTFVQFTFNFTAAGATWRDVTFTPATALSLAGGVRSQDLPGGNVTAFGMFFDVSSNGIRLDDYAINAVPEPSGIMLTICGLSCSLALVVRRVRRSQLRIRGTRS